MYRYANTENTGSFGAEYICISAYGILLKARVLATLVKKMAAQHWGQTV
ncbi:MAG: hypothetical protein QM793_12380 [Muricomes sp.]